MCNSYFIQKTLSGQMDNGAGAANLSFKQRSCIYGGKLISGQAFFGPIFMGGVAQFQDDPIEWGQGTKGYLRRVGSRYAQGVAKSTGEYVFAWVLRENPRYEPSQDRKFWKRFGHAFGRAFVVDHLDGHCYTGSSPVSDSTSKRCARWPAISRLVGASSSGVVGLAWYPDRLNHPDQVVVRGASAYGGYVASAIFSEFQADVFRLLGKMMGSDNGKPARKSEQKKEGEK